MVRFKFKNSLGCAPWPCSSQHNVAQLLVVFHFLEQCLHLRKHWNGINEGDPPPLVHSIQGGLRRYAVRKGLVRSTQKFCYIVRRH